VGRAKEIIVKVIPPKIANDFVKKHHYSGKVVPNSQLHFGAFLDGKLHGVMSYGPSMDKSKLITLVEGTRWNEFIELNRMAFDDYLPRNAESFCIAKSIKLIKKNAPHIKWIVSFADGCSCGDGTIYRASNFILTSVKKNTTIKVDKNGNKVADMTFSAHKPSEMKMFRENYKPLDGFMLRYVYFIDKKCRERLTVPIIPFSKIDELGAGMYKGEKVTQAERHIDNYSDKEEMQ
jgi:hypothetical protein